MNVFLWPSFGPEAGQGGIKRVWEAQRRWLPDHGVNFVDNLLEADLVNIHADYIQTDRPVAYSCHGLYWDGYRWDRWAYEVNARIIKAMKQAQTVSVPSYWVRDTLAHGMLLDPFVLPHGIELGEWIPKNPSNYVVWLKNRPDPICDPTVVNSLAAVCPDIPFITTFGRETSNVSLLGRIPFEEAREVLAHAGAYLATVMETGGITVMEAMAAGVPPLGYRFGANSELIDHMENGYLVEPGDVAALREGLYYILQNRKRLSEAAREKAERQFQWKDRIQGYIPFYQAALDIENTPVKVSVIVTAYNLEEYLPGCIESVLAQDFNDWELIIVDDASPDRCGEIADGFAKRDSRIKSIHNSENKYLAEARNIGIQNSRGKYIVALDADDRLSPIALNVLSQALDRDRNLDIVTGGFEVIKVDGEHFISGWPGNNPSYDQQILKRNQIPYASMYRRWVWSRTGGYRRRMKSAEDAEFWTRAMSYGAVPAKITDVPTLIYNTRPDSMSHSVPEPDWISWFTWAKYPDLTPFAASGTPPSNGVWPVHSYSPPKLSVVIPVGPGHDVYLQDCLDSLIAQTLLDWEVIVVNDTGQAWYDGEGNLINPYLRGYPFVRILDSEDNESHGPAYARNRGIMESNTPLFVLLDADDIAQPHLLEALYKAHLQHGGWVYIDWFKGDGSREKAESWSGPRLMSRQLGPITGIYRKDDWEAVGGLDEEIRSWEDWDFHLMLLEQGVCGTRLAHPLITYRYDTGTQREEGFAHKEEVLQYIQKKHKRLYEDRSFATMACGCAKGGGKSDQTIAPYGDPVSVASAQIDDPENWILVEYIGTPVQMRSMKSMTDRRRSYYYGGEKGSDDRKIFALKVDAAQFQSRPGDFIVYALAPHVEDNGLQMRNDLSSTPALVADRTVGRKAKPLSVLVGKITPETIAILEKNGIQDVERLRRTSKVELLTIKGIGERRADVILGAVRGIS
jgi:glycosyltransferase involved in cell wall biosynthesis